MAVAVCFPTMYGWLAGIVEEMSDKMLEAIGLATAYDWAGWVSGISTLGLVTAIFGLVFVIVYFILYFQFLMRGLEILILRVGMPLACVGLIDNDKGVFKPYMSKFFQSALSVIIQISLAKLGVGLMMNMHIFWGVACMILAVRTPKFLQEFIGYDRRRRWAEPSSTTHTILCAWCRWSGHGKVRWRRMVTMDDLSKAIILLVRVGRRGKVYLLHGAAGSRRGTGGAVQKTRPQHCDLLCDRGIHLADQDLILYYYS